MLKKIEPFTRLLITSRPYLALLDRFPNLISLEISAKSADIRRFVDSEVDMNDRLIEAFKIEPNLRAEIVTALVDKANGV
jgi:hypothetical protein